MASAPRSKGATLKLSSPTESDTAAPHKSAAVRNKSVRQIGVSHVEPGAIALGQRAKNGTRWPPSHASDFWPRKWWLVAWSNFWNSGRSVIVEPLSLVTINSVFSSSPAFSSAPRTCPTVWSHWTTKSPYAPAPLLP